MGLLRIEDVAIGCLVSLVVGVLFWPRGAGSVVGDDLADAFRRGAAYLTQAVDWALGTRVAPPDADAAAVTAGIRLDEALRGFLAEQGTKRVSKEDLWTLVMASMRLRLTAYSLAGLEAPEHLMQHKHRGTAYARTVLAHATADLTGFYERVAMLVGRPVARQVLMPVTVPAFTGLDGHGRTPRTAEDSEVAVLTGAGPTGAGPTGAGLTGAGLTGAGLTGAGPTGAGPTGAGDADGLEDGDGTDLVRVLTAPHHPHLLWVAEHLQHLSSHAYVITGPATHVAEQRRQPWWR